MNLNGFMTEPAFVFLTISVYTGSGSTMAIFHKFLRLWRTDEHVFQLKSTFSDAVWLTCICRGYRPTTCKKDILQHIYVPHNNTPGNGPYILFITMDACDSSYIQLVTVKGPNKFQLTITLQFEIQFIQQYLYVLGIYLLL